MSEASKTLTFIAVGAVALGAAYFLDRPTQAVNVESLVGDMLNTDFEVDQPRRLRIVKFDRETASTRQFEVAALEDGWSIPSKQNYPADAAEQMAAAAGALIDRKILRVAAETADMHEAFGVVDPQSKKLDSKSEGVGTRVIMTDSDDKQLVDMIVGKPVKGSDGQRYVRKTNQDVVYVVELDPASLSTDFNDWIEDDLLKISPFDIRHVFFNDYSADLAIGMTPDGRFAPQVNWERRGEITLGYNNDDAKWTLDSLKKYDRAKKEMIVDALAEDEELNQEALNELRNGLDDLLIVDVARKPEGLSADLKAGENFMTDREAFEDLVAKGFSPLRLKEGADPEILSSEGEIIATMRDGVEYVLRFGQLKVQTDPVTGEPAVDPATGEPASAGGEPSTDAVDEDGKNLHRYLFVMARFNEDAIDKPQLKELPPLPEGAAADAPAAAAPADAAPAAEGEAEAAGDSAPPSEAPATDAPAEPAEGEPAAAAAPPAGGDEPAAAAAPAEPTDETPPAAASEPAPSNPVPGEPASAGVAPATDAANPAAAKPSAAERAAAERKLIEEENQREHDRYNEAVEAGKKKVADLNERFGDWYYVISNDVYKQIHLGRDQVIKKKGPADPAAGGPASAGAADLANPLSGLPNLPLGDATPAPAAEPAPTTQPPPAGEPTPSDPSAASDPAPPSQ